MGLLNINKFKGLRQNIDYPELPLQYCHELQNIDVDNPLGKMKVRDGYSKYHANADDSEFTNILSAYEYRFNTPGSTRFIVNDVVGGTETLKVSADAGSTWTDLTLPGGSVLEAGFRNQYFGWQNHVLITTGNGSTNHILWYGYVDREIDDSNGIFNNALEKTDYILTRSQLITPNGMFANIRSVAYLDGYYYISFNYSRWIEKRNSDFQLEERWAVNEDEAISAEPTAGVYVVVVSANASTGMLYIGTSGGLYEVNPGTHKMVNEDTTVTNIIGICHDGTEIFAVSSSTLSKVTISTFANAGTTTSGLTTITAVSCDDTVTTGAVFIGDQVTVRQRGKNDIGSDDYTYALTGVDAGMTNIWSMEYFDADQIYVACYDATNENAWVVDLDASDVSTKNTQYQDDDVYSMFPIWVGGTTLRFIAPTYGIVRHIDATTLVSPEFLSLTFVSTLNAGELAAGGYFYKIAVEDTDGQIYTLSDEIFTVLPTDDKQVDLRIVATGDRSETDKFIEFYRIKYIHIYRAYSADIEGGNPGTDYKFLKKIDINDGGWAKNATWDMYFFDYVDNQLESEISSTTYQEISGISDETKPRYINGKYLTWLDGQLYLANYSHDGDDYSYGFVRSPVDQPDNLTLYDPFGYDAGGGEPIKDIGNSYGRVVVFKTRSMGTFYNGSPEREYSFGLSSEGGFTKVNEDIYFVSDKGIHLFEGNRVLNIVDSVITYFEAVSSLANVDVFYIEGKDRVLFSFRGDRVLVLNIKHGIWTQYSSAFAFRGFLKNYANMYMGWDVNTLYELYDGSTKDAEDVGGGNGTAIACIYESPLVRFSRVEGEWVTLIGSRHRLRINSGDTLNLKTYEYQNDATGKTLVDTTALTYQGKTLDAAAINMFFDALLGESYSFRLEITAPATPASDDAVFDYHGMTLEFIGGGYKY